MTMLMDAIGCKLFESDNFGGWKIPKYGVSTTLRANKVCAGIVEIRKVDSMYETNRIFEQSRAEQSRAEQSRAEQLDVCRIGNLNGKSGGSFAGQVYDKKGIAPTLTDMQGGGRQPHFIDVIKMETNILGNLQPETKHQSQNVYDENGCAPTVMAGTHGYGMGYVKEQQIVAMRGRDKENPSDRTVGNQNLEQRLEPNTKGTSNTITSVQKDNLVLESEIIGGLEEKSSQRRKIYDKEKLSPTLQAAMGVGGGNIPFVVDENVVAIDEQNNAVRTETFGCLSTDGSSPKHNNRVGEIARVKIREANKKGYAECEIGGVADLNYTSSTTRRGRVQSGGQISPTLTTENIPSVIELGEPDFYNFLYEIDGDIYLIRIRKLTPRECWRLMDFTDEDFEKAQEVNSNTQLYKEAGNSIVVNCLVGIFGQLFEGKEDYYKRM